MTAEAPSTRTVRAVGARAAAAPLIDTPLAWLVFGDGSSWPVFRNVVLGRSPLSDDQDADVVAFDDPTMSRRHLLVDVVGPDAPCFIDLDSRSGSQMTVASGAAAPLTPSGAATDGAEVRFGQTSVRWLSTAMWVDGITSAGIHPLTGRTMPPSVRSHPQPRNATHR